MAKISELFRQAKPFLEDNGKRKGKAGDLRVQVLAQEASKRQCQGLAGALAGPAGVHQATGASRPAAGPTDFSDFFQQLSGHQQDKEERPADDAAMARQQQQQRDSDPLDALLRQHSLAGVAPPQQQLQQLQHMASLDRTFALDASRDGFLRGPEQLQQQAAGSSNPSAASAAVLGQPGGGQARWHLTQLEGIPWDWSVKLRVRFASSAAFSLLEQRRAAGLQQELAGTFAAGQQGGSTGSQLERLAAALVQWQHPAAPLSRGLLAALRGGADKEGTACLAARCAAWRDALRGGYTALRHGLCPVLYVVGQACRQDFAAVFACPGVLAGSERLVAVVSRTNQPLRQHLAAYGAQGQLAGHTQQQQHKQQEAGAQLPAAAFDGQPGSQLLLSGALQVHGLYAALLALPWCGPDQPDVPLILAPVHFRHAQLAPLRLEPLRDAVLEQQQQQQQPSAADCRANHGGQLVQPLHYAELSAPAGGAITPWALRRLLQLLADTQAASGAPGFDAFFETAPCSSSLNLLPGSWTQGSGAADAAAAAAAASAGQWAGAGFSEAEQQGWHASLELLQGRVLKQLQVTQRGDLAARLA